jgi:hypothetical protein
MRGLFPGGAQNKQKEEIKDQDLDVLPKPECLEVHKST